MGDKAEGPKLADYYMSIHYGVCAGPVNALRRLFVGGKRAWRGNVTTQRVFRIDEPDLFEGDSQEGGVGGAVYFLPGDVTQVLPEHLAGRLDLTSDTCPAFRGITSIWMYGEEDEGFGGVIAGADGFYWGTNNPYLKPTSVEVTCIPEDWYGAKAPIVRDLGEPPEEGYTVEGGLAANNLSLFDTFGFRNAYVDIAGPGEVKLWSIPENTLTTIGPLGFAVRGVHITVDGYVVTRRFDPLGGNAPNGDIYFFDFSGTVAAQVTDSPNTLGSLALPFLNHFCDLIGNDGHHYTLLHSRDQFGSFQYCRIKNRAAFSQTATTDDNTNEIVAGPEYAYVRNVAGTGVYRVAWLPTPETDPITSSEITPAGLTAAIANCGYDDTTDSVVIVCTNGDLFRYSPDLSMLILSNTATGIGAVAAGLNSSKRMCPGDGSVVIARREPATSGWHIHIFSTSTLTEIAHYQSLNEDTWNSPTGAYDAVKFNVETQSIALLQHAVTWSQWFLPAAEVADMNPAHIIYHSLTNTDWGMASPTAFIDEDAFIAAADVLFTEGFGLSMMWSQQATIEEFIRDVLNHINATLFVRPSTGLLTLKLIRNDYDAGTLPVLDRDNSRVTSYARKGWGDTVNEVNVSWTNPESEEQETVTMQDLGNISMQGGVVSTSKNYHGIRKRSLAKDVAARDITAESWPLATAQVEVNREAWDYVPGDCVKLTAEEYGVAQVIMRITTVDYGKPGDSKIKLSLVEDIFGLPLAEFVDQAPSSLWEDPSEDPRPIDFALPQTLTYFHAKKVGDVSGAEYPEVRAGMLAAQGGSDTKQFKLLGPTTDAAGNETLFALLGTRSIVSRATLVSGFDAEAQTVVTSAAWTTRTQGTGPVAGGFILIGDDEETENELALVTSTAGGTYTLKRAVLDTVPQEWPAGAPIWFFSNNSRLHDPIIRSALDTISYKVLPVTSNGTLNAGAASPISLTLTERPWLPTRPAGVTVEGIGFGMVDISVDSPTSTHLAVAWFNRNRLTEDSQPLAWTDATVTPETNQTTTVEVLKESDRSVITAHTGLTGTSFSLPIASFGGFPSAIVRVTSERDGYESLQGHEIIVVVSTLVSEEIPSGNLVLSTTAPTLIVAMPIIITPPQGNLVLSSTAPTVAQNVHTAITPPQGNLVLSSVSPTVVNSGDALWTPADGGLGSALSLWFDASDAASVTHASNVISQVNDKSGQNLHVTPAATREPTRVAAEQNGLDVIRFDGGDNLRKTSGVSPNVPRQTQTTFVVCKPTAGVAANLYWTTNGSTIAGIVLMSRSASGLARYAGNSANHAQVTQTGAAAWHMYSGYILASLRSIYVDGTLGDDDTTVESLATAPTQFWFGSDSNPTNFYTGDLGEFVQYNGTLSQADREQVEGYLAWKWGLQANLPGGHPYQSSPP